MHDLKNNLKVSPSLLPATRTADANGTGVDLAGYNGALCVFTFGASGDTLSGTVYVAGVVQESDDNSTFTDVADADLIGTEPLVNDPAEDDAAYVVGYKGAKRYIRCKLDFTGTHTNGIPCATSVIAGNPRHAPVS